MHLTPIYNFKAPRLNTFSERINSAEIVFLRSVLRFFSVFFLAAAIFALSFMIALYAGSVLAYYGGLADEAFFILVIFCSVFPL